MMGLPESFVLSFWERAEGRAESSASLCCEFLVSRGMSRTLTLDRFLDQRSLSRVSLSTPVFLCLRKGTTARSVHTHRHAGDCCATAPGSTATGDIFIFIHAAAAAGRVIQFAASLFRSGRAGVRRMRSTS